MSRSPEDDEREGKTQDLALRRQALTLRRKGLDAWGIAKQLGVSTSTVLQWQTHIFERPEIQQPGVRPEPEPPTRSKRKPKQKPHPLVDLAKQMRRNDILRGRGTPRRKIVEFQNSRYSQQREMQLHTSGVDANADVPEGVYAAPSTAVGVKVAWSPAGGGRVIRPRQVPWHEFDPWN